MKIFLSSFLFLFVSLSYGTEILDKSSFENKWTSIYEDKDRNLALVVQALSESREGKRLLLAAKKKTNSQSFHEFIKIGDYSLTDTTLIRKFSRTNPNDITYESISKVYLDRDLSLKNAVLDLAHELTHFLYREPFNPYQNDYQLDEFIHSTIEGEGGEIQAFLSECNVSFELFGASSQRLCRKVAGDDGRPSFKKAVHEFYKVGKHYGAFKQKLLDHSSSSIKEKITQDYSTFISSAYGQPYPLAAFNEYFGVMRKVCENDQRRLGYMRESQSRKPASAPSPELLVLQQRFESRCKHIL